jgi:hypothetical protein
MFQANFRLGATNRSPLCGRRTEERGGIKNPVRLSTERADLETVAHGGKRFTDTIEDKLAVIAPTVKAIEFGCSGRFGSAPVFPEHANVLSS